MRSLGLVDSPDRFPLMSDAFDDLEPPDPRSILYRVVEGLTVVALLVAVVMWQSDTTLQAARQLLSPADETSTAPVLVAMQPRSSDIRLVAAATGTTQRAEDVDPVETGSIVRSPPAVAPPMPAPLVAAPTRIPALQRVVPAAVAPSIGWSAACDSANGLFCTASQTLSQPDDPLVETSWTIQHSDSGLTAIWTTPTNVLVARGMVIIMGDGQPKTVPFSGCGAHSCEVRARLAGDFITLLRQSQRVSTEIVLKSGKTVTFDFSPEGLDSALAKLGV